MELEQIRRISLVGFLEDSVFMAGQSLLQHAKTGKHPFITFVDVSSCFLLNIPKESVIIVLGVEHLQQFAHDIKLRR